MAAATKATVSLSNLEQRSLNYIKRYKAQGYSQKEIREALVKSKVPSATISKTLKLAGVAVPFYQNSAFYLSIGVLIAVIVVALAVVVLLPSSELECSVDDDCSRGEVCDDGVCVDEEDERIDVDEGDEEETGAEEDTGCAYDSDCDSGYECEDGTCEEDSGVEPQCGDGNYDIGEDCIEDYVCNDRDPCDIWGEGLECVDGSCVEEGSSSSGSDTAGDDAGTSESAECAEDDDCGDGAYCSQEVCVATACYDGADNDGDELYDAYGSCLTSDGDCGCDETSYVSGYSLADWWEPYLVNAVEHGGNYELVDSLMLYGDESYTSALTYAASALTSGADIASVSFDWDYAGDYSTADLEGYNLILFGGPCVNDLVEEIFGYSCADWAYGTDEGVVSYVAFGDTVALLIAGGDSATDTAYTAKAFSSYYYDFGFCGVEALIEIRDAVPETVSTLDSTCSGLTYAMSLCDDDTCEDGCSGTFYDADDGCRDINDEDEMYACANFVDDDGDDTRDVWGGCDIDDDGTTDYVCGCDIDEDHVFTAGELMSYDDCVAGGANAEEMYGCDTDLDDTDTSYDTAYTCTGEGELWYAPDEECLSSTSNTELEDVECDDDRHCAGFVCEEETQQCLTACADNGDCAESYACIGAVCEEALDIGESCSEDAYCASEVCAEDVCVECEEDTQCSDQYCTAAYSCAGYLDCDDSVDVSEGESFVLADGTVVELTTLTEIDDGLGAAYDGTWTIDGVETSLAGTTAASSYYLVEEILTGEVLTVQVACDACSSDSDCYGYACDSSAEPSDCYASCTNDAHCDGDSGYACQSGVCGADADENLYAEGARVDGLSFDGNEAYADLSFTVGSSPGSETLDVGSVLISCELYGTFSTLIDSSEGQNDALAAESSYPYDCGSFDVTSTVDYISSGYQYAEAEFVGYVDTENVLIESSETDNEVRETYSWAAADYGIQTVACGDLFTIETAAYFIVEDFWYSLQYNGEGSEPDSGLVQVYDTEESIAQGAIVEVGGLTVGLEAYDSGSADLYVYCAGENVLEEGDTGCSYDVHCDDSYCVDGVCVECDSDDRCADGEVCYENSCVLDEGEEADVPCVEDDECTDGWCVDGGCYDFVECTDGLDNDGDMDSDGVDVYGACQSSFDFDQDGEDDIFSCLDDNLRALSTTACEKACSSYGGVYNFAYIPADSQCSSLDDDKERSFIGGAGTVGPFTKGETSSIIMLDLDGITKNTWQTSLDFQAPYEENYAHKKIEDLQVPTGWKDEYGVIIWQPGTGPYDPQNEDLTNINFKAYLNTDPDVIGAMEWMGNVMQWDTQMIAEQLALQGMSPDHMGVLMGGFADVDDNWQENALIGMANVMAADGLVMGAMAMGADKIVLVDALAAVDAAPTATALGTAWKNVESSGVVVGMAGNLYGVGVSASVFSSWMQAAGVDSTVITAALQSKEAFGLSQANAVSMMSRYLAPEEDEGFFSKIYSFLTDGSSAIDIMRAWR